jgi:hypothetical protein
MFTEPLDERGADGLELSGVVLLQGGQDGGVLWGSIIEANLGSLCDVGELRSVFTLELILLILGKRGVLSLFIFQGDKFLLLCHTLSFQCLPSSHSSRMGL